MLFRCGLRAELGPVLAFELEGDGVDVAEDGERGFMVAVIAVEEMGGSGVLLDDILLCQEGMEEERSFRIWPIEIKIMTSRRRETGIRKHSQQRQARETRQSKRVEALRQTAEGAGSSHKQPDWMGGSASQRRQKESKSWPRQREGEGKEAATVSADRGRQ